MVINEFGKVQAIFQVGVLLFTVASPVFVAKYPRFIQSIWGKTSVDFTTNGLCMRV